MHGMESYGVLYSVGFQGGAQKVATSLASLDFPTSGYQICSLKTKSWRNPQLTSSIEGFGQKTEEKILKDIQRLIHSEKRTPYSDYLPECIGGHEFLYGL